MAASLSMIFFFLPVFTASASEPVLLHRYPHLTGCVSANMETFRCRWNVGTSQSLSEPGDLRLFYINQKPPHASPKDWSECPQYSTDNPNECFFNENHTSIWTYYSVQLRSKDQAILYDENLFYVQDIVQPDPPVDLNWTLLNVSLTGAYYDIMLSWKPPQSADVNMGWMTLQYEVQYRDDSSDMFEAVNLVKSTHRSLYGLQTNVNHEVRVRCKMLGGKEFGEYSDSIFVHIPSKVSRFPVVALLVFGALCLVAILMLVVISQQEKLMVILLPPVPGPKIRGIDSELLKKGKLRELTSILGGPPDLRPELYNNDPWVEFIDLDIEEQNDRQTDHDTDCLMHRSLSSTCTPLSIGFRDDDSGRASCCDPDLPSDPEPSHFLPLIPTQTLSKEPSFLTASEPSSPGQSPTAGEPPFVAPGIGGMYTQVSEVMLSGKVLLSPEEQKTAHVVVENERLKNEMADLKQQNERTAEDGEAEVQRLVSEMRAQSERHKRELETVRQQCSREVEDAKREAFNQLEAKDAEITNLLEKKDLDLEEMKKRLKNQERERQSELLKLQMEFGAKLARVQSTAQWSQQQQRQEQQHGSSLLPQSVFKRKLQFFQEEKNKEIEVLRQRIKELEANQRAGGLNDSRLKRRKI